MSIPNQSKDKLDKRADALRENLKKRKAATKARKADQKKTDDKKKDDA